MFYGRARMNFWKMISRNVLKLSSVVDKIPLVKRTHETI
jgi:hypothetical protein